MFTDPDPEKFVLNKTVAENEVTSEEDRYRRKGRRTRKRNTVEFPTADIEVFVVVDKETVAIHGNASIEEYVLTMMNMVRLILFSNRPFSCCIHAITSIFSKSQSVVVSQFQGTVLPVLQLLSPYSRHPGGINCTIVLGV